MTPVITIYRKLFVIITKVVGLFFFLWGRVSFFWCRCIWLCHVVSVMHLQLIRWPIF